MTKKIMYKKISAVLLAAVLASTLFGCGKSVDQASINKNDEAFLKYLETADYPLKTDKKLTWWVQRGGTGIGQFTDPQSFPSLELYKKNTGVDVDIIFPTTDVKTQFNLMIASGSIPDIIGYYWGVPADYPGGPERAISDGIIADISDLIPKYAPNFQKYLDNTPIAKKDLKTDNGSYYYVPEYVTTEEKNGSVTNGYIFRKDWLDELGLPIPETIEDWYITLKAFKEKKGVEIPLTFQYVFFKHGITNPYNIALGGTAGGLFVENGKVKYGFIEPSYKEFLAEMHKWYAEGLMDRSIASIDQKSVDSKIVNGRSGATYGWNGWLSNWITAGREQDPNFSLIGVPFPVRNRGEKPKFGSRDAMIYNAGAAISQSCENKELALKLLDYGFTEKGREALQFGEENVTYVIEDGQYKYTDLITKNPDGLTQSQATSVYVTLAFVPRFRDQESMRASYTTQYIYPEQEQSIKAWEFNDPRERWLPTLMPSADKMNEYAQLYTQVSTYANEMMLKFIVGEEPLDNFDKYIEEMNKKGAQEVISIIQDSYNRYLQR